MSKSKFQQDAENAKEKLDEVSPSLCLAKWQQVSLHLSTGTNNSCYHPPLHKIPIESILTDPGKLHNTDYKKHTNPGRRPKAQVIEAAGTACRSGSNV